jgi:hypothetical protein
MSVKSRNLPQSCDACLLFMKDGLSVIIMCLICASDSSHISRHELLYVACSILCDERLLFYSVKDFHAFRFFQILALDAGCSRRETWRNSAAAEEST